MNLDALIFVPALVGSVILGFVFLMFASNYFLAVLEGTAAGAKEIPWEGAPITDSFTKVFYLGWLLGLWTGPAYLVTRFVAPADPWAKLAVPLFVMWVLYPVSQLASLSASTPWVPLNADVFARLAQRPLVTAGFYALTLPVFAVGGVAFKWAYLTRGEVPLLVAGVPVFAFVILIYARLLGRLAFGLMFTKDLLKRRKKKKPKPATAEPRAAEVEEPVAVPQPSELPPIDTPDGELAGYDVLIADDPPPAPRKRVVAQVADEDDAPAPKPPRRGSKPARPPASDEDDDRPYAMNAAEGAEPERERLPAEVLKPRADELALLDRRDAPKPPKRVWSGELFVFLLQPGTASALLILIGVGAAAGVMVRVARAFDPTLGAE